MLIHSFPKYLTALLVLQSTFSFSSEIPDTTPFELTAEYARSAVTRVEGEPSELSAVVELTGAEPQAIYLWVREHIRYEGYAGIRKGAEGTLISGSGNSADQALLLATLFEYVGIPALLVNASIGKEDLPPPAEASKEDRNEIPTAEALEALAQTTGVGIESLYAQVEGLQRSRQTFLENLWSRTLNDLDVLAGKLDEAGISVPQMPEKEAGEVNHWWVRTADNDFDLILDKPLQEADSEYALSELPETLFEQVKVRMWIQRSEDADDGEMKVEPESVLDVAFRSAELFGNPLYVGNIPLDIEPSLADLKNPSPDQVIEVFGSAKQFQPQLNSPRGLLAGHPFDKSGRKLQIKEGRIESVTKIGSSMGGLFGGGGVSQEPDSHLIALWLEIELVGAEESGNIAAPVVVRRDILQHPSSATSSLEILSTREILVQADELTSAWLTRKSLHHIADTADYTRSMLEPSASTGSTAASLMKLTSDRPQLTHELYGFGLARKNELLRLRDKIAPRAVMTKDHPMVISVVRGFSCPEDEIHIRNGLDILYQALNVANNEPKNWKQSLPFAVGVMDTALELTIMERMHAPESIRNASQALERSLASGGQPEVIVEEGFVRIEIPGSSSGQGLAYYEVNLNSGMSLGMMDGGGQAMAEYAEYTNVVLQLKGVFEFYGDLFRCMGMAITYPLTGKTAQADVALAKCVYDVACGQITGLVGTFVDVDTNWTNIIAQETVNQLFSQVCSQIWKQL